MNNWIPDNFMNYSFGYIKMKKSQLIFDNIDIPSFFVKVGTFNSPTVTGSQSVTGIGFQPKALIFFGSTSSSDGASDNAELHFGATDQSLNKGAISVSDKHNVVTTLSRRAHTNASIVTLDPANGTINGRSNVTALDSDGFTLNWTTVAATAFRQRYIALGGSIKSSLTQIEINSNGANESFAHGLGEAPTAILFFHATTLAGLEGSQPLAGLSNCHGVWTASGQYAISSVALNNVSTSRTRSLVNTGSVFDRLYTWPFDSDVTKRSMSVTSVDSINVNVTYPITAENTRWFCWMLAIGGCKAICGSVKFNGNTNTVTIPCLGIVPKLYMPLFSEYANDFQDYFLGNIRQGIGAYDGLVEYGANIVSDHHWINTNVSSTISRKNEKSNSFRVDSHTSNNNTVIMECTARFLGESVQLHPTTLASNDVGQHVYLILGQ